LTYVGEAKEWIEACLNEDLPPITEFEEHLRNGVFLAKLGRFFSPDMVKKIFDETQQQKLNLRHSDNFNHFIAAATKVGLPKIFYFELTDLYDRKNMPKVIYMIHALSLYLVKLGLAPKMKKKKYKFTDEELAFASEQLGDIQLPAFGDLANQMAKETGASKQNEIDQLQNDYEARAVPFSQWVEEQTANLESREFNFASSDAARKLLDNLLSFRENEKPPKREELESLAEALKKIDELLTSEKKDRYEPPDFMKIEKLQEEWRSMEEAENKRETALQRRLELAQLEEKANVFKTWAREQSALFGRRNYDDADTAELNDLRSKIAAFRQNEKPNKQKEYEEFCKAFAEYEQKTKSSDPDFSLAAQRHREELERIWSELENNEANRDSDLQFRIDMIKLKGEYSASAKGLSSWAQEKTKELDVRDFETKNSAQLHELIQHFNKYKSEVKPPKQELFEKAEKDFAHVNQLLSAHEYPEFEPTDGTAIEDVRTNWKDLSRAERDREEALRLKHELATMEEAYLNGSSEIIQWTKERIEKLNDRNFPKTSEECLKLAGEDMNFKKTEKVKKEEFKNELFTDFHAIAAKIRKEGHSEFKLGDEQTPPGITNLWAQMEKAEAERASALASEQIRLGDEERLKLLRDHEDFWIKLQAIARGNEARRKLQAMKDYYKSHEDKIIKIQALWRSKTAGEHYRALNKENPPVATIQKFLHLLDDSDKDFDEELELEKLKQQVVVEIRDNNERERQINLLDIKIALLIKNRTTLDDVVESTKKYMKKQKNAEHVDHGLKSLDKDARSKLEGYQHLFYLLQTEPRYLAGLIFQLKKKDRVQKFIETIVLTLYGYAQNDREEYLLLQLFKYAIEFEMEQVMEPQDIHRGNPVFLKLVVQYTRGVKERQFLRELLGPLIKDVISQTDLDLDVDPLSIYRGLIKEEESRTGEKSALAYDVSRSQALENDKVMKVFVKRLKDLRSITDKFLNAIIASLPKLPYGLRYIASQMRLQLEAKFPNEEEKITKIVGNLVYYRYMNPALVAPEGFDVIESLITPVQRKNLGEISKMLQQISVGKIFEDEYFYLSALNDSINKSKTKFFKFFQEASQVISPEEYFRIDKYDDFSKTQKPTIYISQEEIYSTHALLLETLEDVAPKKDDKLRVILNDLGTPPEGSAEATSRGAEMSLVLTNRFANVEDEDTEMKTLFVQTKRQVLAVIRVQQGDNLLQILEKPVTANEEKLFALQMEKEEAQSKDRQSKGSEKKPSLMGLAELTFEGLKKKTLENMGKLEKKGTVSKANNYQEMLNAVAKDIKNKNRRRIQRKAELEKIKKTLANLEEKSNYLEGQYKSYKEYVDACVASMTDRGTKKAKKKNFNPFSAQYFHEQKLKKQGKEYQFGSFKYTADKLFEKGVLVSLEGVPVSQRNKVSITISSDEVGVFEVQGKFLGVQVDAMELRLDDLLQKQFDNVQVITLFETAKVNVNLLIYLLNKKFYV